MAIIPARGGSSRVPRKNLLPLAGLPLVAHTVLQATAAKVVDEVCVSTDDPEIAATAETHGAEVIRRPVELSGGEATSESVLLHVLDERLAQGLEDPELVVFLQCTSPVRQPSDIDSAVAQLLETGADSLLSACEDRSHIWTLESEGPRSVTYDFRARRPEQDMPPQYRENGSIYVFRPTILREEGNRLGGRIAIYEMGFWSSFQLDAPEDAELLSWILTRASPQRYLPWPDQIELIVFDFDGVMTDNKVLVSDTGAETVRCNRADGWGVARLLDAGVPMIVLSTEAHPVVSARSKKLGIPCHQDIEDKAAFLERFLDQRGVAARNVAYVGNDVNDLACLDQVGLPVAVADADPRVLSRAKLVLSRRGGDGAVRELCDMVLARLQESSGVPR